MNAAAAEGKKGKRQCRLKWRTRRHRTFSSRPLSTAVKTASPLLSLLHSTLLTLLFLVLFVSGKIYIVIRSFPRAI